VERAKLKREEQKALAASQTGGAPQRTGADASEEPPEGLSAMERTKWKMQLKKKKQMEQHAEQSSTW